MSEILLLRSPKAQGNEVDELHQLLCALQPSVPAYPGYQRQFLPSLSTRAPPELLLVLVSTKSHLIYALFLLESLKTFPLTTSCSSVTILASDHSRSQLAWTPLSVHPFYCGTNL